MMMMPTSTVQSLISSQAPSFDDDDDDDGDDDDDHDDDNDYDAMQPQRSNH